uniref:hypothetical protein n=1 Tax=Polaromonas glacialis TaxID=866564 RepID=UPI000496104E|nr:hypothetical protein [Polaromonas glacialis]
MVSGNAAAHRNGANIGVNAGSIQAAENLCPSLKSRFLLMDCWFASKENFEFITDKQSHFIAAPYGTTGWWR